ncbi:MAG: DHHW family protein [Oscillospiraceae bacterium]
MKESPKKKQHTSRLPRGLALPFLLVLAVLTVVAFLLPLRPERSYSEKRELTAFPDFSWQALLSGDWFDGIGLWFSDTFPGRETWLTVSAGVEQLHGIQDVTVHGNIPQADPVPTVPAAAEATPAPTPVSTPEASPAPTPEATPVPTPELVLTAPPVESVEEWGGIKADEDAEVIFGSVLQVGDAAYSYFGFSQSGCDRYAAIVSAFADRMEGTRVYCAPMPTGVGVMISSDYQEKLRCSDQGASISYTLSAMSDSVCKVNVFNNLVAHNDEYIYFRTDHHWTALGAYYAYESFCAAAGMEAAPLDAFEEWDQGEFLGSFYYECSQSSRLKADTVYAYDPPGDFTVYITGEDGGTFEWTVLTDMSKSSKGSKYMCFLAGDHPLTTITNNDLPDAPDIVVIKDSFGNPFVPYLTQNYHTVYVMDYRSYFTMKLDDFVAAYGVEEVLFLQNLALAQSSGVCDLTESLCR